MKGGEGGRREGERSGDGPSKLDWPDSKYQSTDIRAALAYVYAPINHLTQGCPNNAWSVS